MVYPRLDRSERVSLRPIKEDPTYDLINLFSSPSKYSEVKFICFLFKIWFNDSQLTWIYFGNASSDHNLWHTQLWCSPMQNSMQFLSQETWFSLNLETRLYFFDNNGKTHFVAKIISALNTSLEVYNTIVGYGVKDCDL